jgi:ParB family chromosome partitioning protein
VVETATGYRLIVGGHRLAGHSKAGRTEILADVKDVAIYADEAACRLREIKENMVRAELSVLDRAVSLAEWKRIYEADNPLPKRGRPALRENGENISNIFVERFSAAAARALGITERSVQLALEVASIDAEVRRKLALHEVSDSQSELLTLARQSAARQRQIAKLLLDPESGIAYVDDAIAAIDKTPAPARSAAWEKLSNSFSKLKLVQQHAFFDAHRDAITDWMKGQRA